MIHKENETDTRKVSLGFPQNRYEALEESRRLLGIAKSDFSSLLEAMGKADYGTLDFNVGDVSICLSSYGCMEICLKLGLTRGPIERSAEYTFQLCEIGLRKKQRTLWDF